MRGGTSSHVYKLDTFYKKKENGRKSEEEDRKDAEAAMQVLIKQRGETKTKTVVKATHPEKNTAGKTGTQIVGSLSSERKEKILQGSKKRNATGGGREARRGSRYVKQGMKEQKKNGARNQTHSDQSIG